jgi:hypothetical protein
MFIFLMGYFFYIFIFLFLWRGKKREGWIEDVLRSSCGERRGS